MQWLTLTVDHPAVFSVDVDQTALFKRLTSQSCIDQTALFYTWLTSTWLLFLNGRRRPDCIFLPGLRRPLLFYSTSAMVNTGQRCQCQSLLRFLSRPILGLFKKNINDEWMNEWMKMNEWMNEWMNKDLFLLSNTTFINEKVWQWDIVIWIWIWTWITSTVYF